VSYLEIGGFALEEIGAENLQRLWLRGSLPPSYLARTQAQSIAWREDFIRTFLERDLSQLGSAVASASLRRFWNMLAHYHGQIWNAAEFARSFGVSHSTVRRYLDLLTATFAVIQLQPWHENLKKRQVRAPKVYLSDSGLLHALLNLGSLHDLEGHPKIGASWEGFLLNQIVHRLGVRPRECYFWATHSGAELDLLVVRGRRRFGFEIKRTVSPKITPSMRNAIADLRLNRLDIVHAGDSTYPVTQTVRALAASKLLRDLRPIR
jgi:predicted AAA+ superfamily ATPase